MFTIEQIDHIALTVKDMQRSIAWYQEVLGLERCYQEAWGDGPPVMLCAGKTCLALFPATTAQPLPPPDQNTIAMRHFAFRTNRANFEQAQTELRRRGMQFVFQDHGISHSIYFPDPDGHEVEITTYDL
jgi:catechol 2,3-dioxygenase-like lactoylglutathione lyase family enzyme